MRKLMSLASVLLVALMMPVAAYAECVTVLSKSTRPYRGANSALVFSGTVTEVDLARYLVSFQVERVWTGELRRESTFFVAPVVEGAQVTSFQRGISYLVTVDGPVRVFSAEDARSVSVPAGTLFIAFSCGDGPTPLAKAKDDLTRLGRGRAPTP